MNRTFAPVGLGQIDGPDFVGQGRPTIEIGVKGASSMYSRVCVPLLPLLCFTVALGLQTHSQGQALEELLLLLLARRLPPSRTALNRDIVAFVSRPEPVFSHPSSAVNTSRRPVEAFRSGTVGKDTNTGPIKGRIINAAGAEPVITAHWPADKGHSVSIETLGLQVIAVCYIHPRQPQIAVTGRSHQ